MSHVDEGALHAYLDGALDEYPAAEAERIRTHLDACAECAERLEVERQVRSDAHALLGMAAPEVEVPSFEELRAYVQRTRRQERGTSRLRRMGWAASVVLAVGAGWMLRDGQLQSRALDIGQEMAAPSRVAPADVAPAAGVAAPSSEDLSSGGGEGMASTTRGRSVEVTSSRAEDQAVRRAAFEDPGDAAAAEPTMRAADRGTMQANKGLEPAAPAEGGALPAPVDESMVVADADAPRDAPAPEETTMVVAAPEASMDVVALEPAAADVLAGPDSGRAAEAEVAPTARAAEQRERSAAPSVMTSALQARQGQAAPSSEAVVAEEVDDETGPEPLLSVPGHEVVDVTNLGDGSTPWGVRVRQRSADGRTFEVVHLEPGIDPAILPDLESGTEEVRRETAFGWVLVRGQLSRSELQGLLTGLFPAAS